MNNSYQDPFQNLKSQFLAYFQNYLKENNTRALKKKSFKNMIKM